MKRFRKIIAIGISVIIIIVAVLWGKAQYVVPIVMYHKVDDSSATSGLSVSPESFGRQMYFLKSRHYNVAKLEDIQGMVKKDRFPSKTIAITFDDGYENNYTNAYPVLKSLGLHANIGFIAESKHRFST